MAFFLKRKLLSQNFFKDPRLVGQLVGLANFGSRDTVVDIGAGSGIITAELAKVCGRVLAVEIDPELVVGLKRQFAASANVEMYQADIRQFALPGYDYKVFANIPFSITTDIVYKLLYYSLPPTEAYLVAPREAAEKFAGVPRESQFSALAKPWFEFQILRTLSASDFSPEPDVEVVLMKIARKLNPLVSSGEETLYRSFIKFAFGSWKKDLKTGLGGIFTYNQWVRLARDNSFDLHARPTDLSFNQWLAVFRFFVSGVDPARQGLVLGE